VVQDTSSTRPGVVQVLLFWFDLALATPAWYSLAVPLCVIWARRSKTRTEAAGWRADWWVDRRTCLRRL